VISKAAIIIDSPNRRCFNSSKHLKTGLRLILICRLWKTTTRERFHLMEIVVLIVAGASFITKQPNTLVINTFFIIILMFSQSTIYLLVFE